MRYLKGAITNTDTHKHSTGYLLRNSEVEEPPFGDVSFIGSAPAYIIMGIVKADFNSSSFKLLCFVAQEDLLAFHFVYQLKKKPYSLASVHPLC